jgi:SAM-dependent methyltransferase
MSLQEVTWFHPSMMDAALRESVEPVHQFMGLPQGTPLAVHAEGQGGLIIEGSKHWEYPHAIRRTDLLSKGGSRVLDAGCGRSAFPAYLAGRGLCTYGIDLSHSALARLSPHGVMVSRGSLDAIPFRDEAFDQVFCISVLEHTRDPLRGFDELWRVTRLGGTVTVTGDYAPWGLPPRTMSAGRVMDHALLARLIGSHGHAPPETPALLEGLGYFRQMWPTLLPIYLRFLKDTPAPPDHAAAGERAPQRLEASALEATVRHRLALQCFRAARQYLAHDWLAEARLLFTRAWRLDHRLGSALAWRSLTCLPLPALRLLRHLLPRRRDAGKEA